MESELFWGIVKNFNFKIVLVDKTSSLDYIFHRLLNTAKYIDNIDNVEDVITCIYDKLEATFNLENATVFHLDDAYIYFKTNKNLKYYYEGNLNQKSDKSTQSGYIFNLDTKCVQFYKIFPSHKDYYEFPFDVFVTLQ